MRNRDVAQPATPADKTADLEQADPDAVAPGLAFQPPELVKLLCEPANGRLRQTRPLGQLPQAQHEISVVERVEDARRAAKNRFADIGRFRLDGGKAAAVPGYLRHHVPPEGARALSNEAQDIAFDQARNFVRNVPEQATVPAARGISRHDRQARYRSNHDTAAAADASN